MANATLSIDENLLRRARIRALERGTTVNAVVREFLESYTSEEERRLWPFSRARRSIWS